MIVLNMQQGKDALLHALAALCVSCHSAISSADPSAVSAILSVITTACTKKQKKFQEAALCALEQVIHTQPLIHELLFLDHLQCLEM